MCLSPRLRPNPYYGVSVLNVKNGRFNRLHDTRSRYIYTPCGVCPECRHQRQLHYAQRNSLIGCSCYQYFVTLTYCPAALPYVSICGKKFYFADYEDIKLMFKRLRNCFSYKFKYLVCSEFGKKNHRPHFHMIISVPYEKFDIVEALSIESELRTKIFDCWCFNASRSRKHPVYCPNTVYAQKIIRGKLYFNYDCHYIDPSATRQGGEDVSYYTTKYTVKYDKFVSRFKFSLKQLCDSFDVAEIAQLPVGSIVFSKNSVNHLSILNKYSHCSIFYVLWRILAPKVCSSKDFLFLNSDDADTRSSCVRDKVVSLVKSMLCYSVNNNLDRPTFFSPNSGKGSSMSYSLFSQFATLEQFEFFKFNNSFDDVDSLFISDKDATSEGLRREVKYSLTDKIMSDSYGCDVCIDDVDLDLPTIESYYSDNSFITDEFGTFSVISDTTKDIDDSLTRSLLFDEFLEGNIDLQKLLNYVQKNS